MKHRIAGRKLSRDRSARKALFKNLINSLVLNGRIETTEAKAKSVRPLAEKLITIGKKNTISARRRIASYLQNKLAVHQIVAEISPLFRSRPGGYTRITRIGNRRGDNAFIVRLELVEKPVAKKPAVKDKPVKAKPVTAPKKGEKTVKKAKTKK